MDVEVRRATVEDAAELTRLREVMLSSMAPLTDTSWRELCVATLQTLLADPDGPLQAFVVDAPDEPGVLASSSVGVIEQRLPSPHNPSGTIGYILNVATDPRYRRRGLGRAVVVATVDWLSDRGVDRVELHASNDGEPLYRELGFQEPRGLALIRWIKRKPPAQSP
jgi:ribosomal protein S18 acetylase RimI-like enzyme